jgi:23S rRNA-intervening sequence protein
MFGGHTLSSEQRVTLCSEVVMTTNSSFQDLRIWQESMDLTVEIYRATSDFPRHEIYGLTSQMRRAAVSVPSNIAEGKGHRSDPEFVRFLFPCPGISFGAPDPDLDSPSSRIPVRGEGGQDLSQRRWNRTRIERPNQQIPPKGCLTTND